MANEELERYVESQVEKIDITSGTELNNYLIDLFETIALNDEIIIEKDNKDEELDNIIDISDKYLKLDLLLRIFDDIKKDEDKKLFIEGVINRDDIFDYNIIKEFVDIKNSSNLFAEEIEEDLEENLEEEIDEIEENIPSDNNENTEYEEEQEEKNEEKEEKLEEELEETEIAKYERETDILKEKLERLENELKESNKGNEEEINSLEQMIIETENKKEELLKEEPVNDTEIENLNNLIESYKNKLEEIKNNNKEIDKDKIKQENLYNEEFASAFSFEDYQNELNDIEQKKTSLVEFQKNDEIKIQILKQEIEKLNEQYNKVPEGLSNISQRFAINYEITQKQESLSELENRFNNIQEEINELNQKADEIKNIIENDNFEMRFNKVSEMLINQKQEEEKQLEIINQKRETLKEEINNIKVTIEALNKEINEIEIILNTDIDLSQKIVMQDRLKTKQTGLMFETNKLKQKEEELLKLDNEYTNHQEIIESMENEINIRNKYMEIVNKINGLLDIDEAKQEEIDSIKNEIDNNVLDDDLKNDLNTKLENTIEALKEVKSTDEIDKLREEIKEREENIEIYYDALDDINELEIDINENTLTKEEQQEKIENIKNKINQLPKELKDELNEILNNVLGLGKKPPVKPRKKVKKVLKNIANWFKKHKNKLLLTGIGLALTSFLVYQIPQVQMMINSALWNAGKASGTLSAAELENLHNLNVGLSKTVANGKYAFDSASGLYTIGGKAGAEALYNSGQAGLVNSLMNFGKLASTGLIMGGLIPNIIEKIKNYKNKAKDKKEEEEKDIEEIEPEKIETPEIKSDEKGLLEEIKEEMAKITAQNQQLIDQNRLLMYQMEEKEKQNEELRQQIEDLMKEKETEKTL